MKKFSFLIPVFCVTLLFAGAPAFAQLTKIMGKITDATTKEPLPFVNLLLKGTTVGVQTAFDGTYSIETKNGSDSLIASFIGYNKQAKKIQKAKFQTVDFELIPSNTLLKEVVILPGENPAEVMLRHIIENKTNNNLEKLNCYQYQAYTKIQVDANNISEKFMNRTVFKPIKFIFDNLDTSTVNGKAYLPILLTENLSNIYYRKDPRSKKEVIQATRVSGMKNQSFSQFAGDRIQYISIYDNHIVIFEKNFVSPIANFGLTFYKYYLVDSTFKENQWCYKIMFKPRRKQELTFTGEFWVHDTTWAVKSIDMRMAEDANLNFINDLVVRQDFERINNQNWMLTKDQMVVDFNIVEQSKTTMGFFGRRITSYRDFIFDKPKDDAFYNKPINTIIETGSLDKDDDFWTSVRHDSLTKDEKIIYHMVDTLKTISEFRNYVDIVKMISTGYYVKGDFEWGPYMSSISFNTLEGTRFRLGGRTSNKFSTKFMLDGYVAYGSTDQRMKYRIGVIKMLGKNPRRAIGGHFKYDMEEIGASQNSFRTDFLFASLFRKSPIDQLSMVEEMHGFYEHEWFTGLTNKIRYTGRKIFTVGNSQFLVTVPGDTMKHEKLSIKTSEIGFDARFAYQERIIMGEFERISLGAKFPILEIKYSYGIPNFFMSDYEYQRLQINVTHIFNVGMFGYSKYIVEFGRVWGKVPYPLLKIHEGNETYSLDEYAFNTMNYFEFVSDRYASVFYTHHFEGFFLNRIPLLRKLKWREVGYARALVGQLKNSTEVQSLAAFPDGISGPQKLYTLDPTKPYVEMGAGIENIFKLFRMDVIWRMSYLDHPNITKVGYRVTLWFTF
ncbi:MAG: DUF5686 family protein [Bacteroidota bacterium]